MSNKSQSPREDLLAHMIPLESLMLKLMCRGREKCVQIKLSGGVGWGATVMTERESPAAQEWSSYFPRGKKIKRLGGRPSTNRLDYHIRKSSNKENQSLGTWQREPAAHHSTSILPCPRGLAFLLSWCQHSSFTGLAALAGSFLQVWEPNLGTCNEFFLHLGKLSSRFYKELLTAGAVLGLLDNCVLGFLYLFLYFHSF